MRLISDYNANEESSVPLPVSVTLYNLFLANVRPSQPSSCNDDDDDDDENDHHQDATAATKTRSLWRPEYTSDLLIPVRLDVVLVSSSQEHDEEEDDSICLYSSTNNRGGIHPSWNHLDERIPIFSKDDHRSIYPSMRLRLYAIMLKQQEQDDSVLVVDMPLHPSRLRRLPSSASDTNSSNSLWEERSWSVVPNALPPNAVLIEYTDGSIRVLPPLYHLLLSERVIVEPNLRDLSLLKDEEEEYRLRPRFPSDVFDALDQVTTTLQRPSPSSLLETDDESKAVPIKSYHSKQDNVLLSSDHHDDEGNSFLLSELSISNQDNAMNPLERSILPCQVDSAIHDLKQEKQELELLAAQEYALLKQDLDRLHKKKDFLKHLVMKVEHAKDEIRWIEQDTFVVRCKQREAEFRLKAQRIKLMKELQLISPIQHVDQTWLIRDLEIPSSPANSAKVSEEELSAALGFLCHALIMMSKYLSIPLAYRIVCNSSRSAIQQDAVTILPLFQARVVEREELHRAMTLLHRNVDCILKTVKGKDELNQEQDQHVLSKVKQIYDTIIGNDER